MGINHVYINTYMCCIYIYCITGIYIYIYIYSVLIYFYMFIYMVYIYIYTVTSLEWWFVSELIPKWLHVLAILNLWMIIIQPSILYIYTLYIRQMPGLARNRDHDRLRIIIIIKPSLKIFNECTSRSLTGVGELNPYWRSSMNVEV